MAHHNTVLSQLLKQLPRHEFEKLANQHDGKRRSDALDRWSQFVAMATAHLTGRNSLRDIQDTLSSQAQHHYHLATRAVSKSALSRANEGLGHTFYQSLFGRLYQRCMQHSPRHDFRFKRKLFSLDGSIINLSLKLFPWADYNRKKAAFKLHVGLDHDGLIPAFTAITVGTASEMEQAKHWAFPKGSVVVFDKGYNSYGWHNTLTEQGITWVTRIRGNALYRILERRPINKRSGVTSDQIIEYTGVNATRQGYKPIRRIGYRDPQDNKHYVFITNQTTWSAQTIADIYKQRWQVELFFKWIKQNLKIKTFMGISKNAVMTQIMVALCVYLLLSYLKFSARISKSLQQIMRLLQTNLFIRRSLLELLKPGNSNAPPDRQLSFGLVRN
jgi:putative transposase